MELSDPQRDLRGQEKTGTAEGRWSSSVAAAQPRTELAVHQLHSACAGAVLSQCIPNSGLCVSVDSE